MPLTYPVDHIGIAVTDLNASIEHYRKSFSLEVDLRETVEEQKVELAFLKLENTLLELLAPTDDSSTLARFLQKRGPGIHHICFRVPDIRKELKRLSDDGYALIDEEPRRGAHNSRIAFLHPRDMGGVLIELCERDVGK